MVQNSPGNTAGVAFFTTDTFTGADDIFYSQDPHPITQNFPVNSTYLTARKAAATTAGNNIAIEYGRVVGINSSGEIVDATVGSGTGHVALLGVVAGAVMNDASEDLHVADPAGVDATSGVPVFIHGYFDITGLVWPAAFTTDTLKKNAAFQADGARYGSMLLFGKKAYAGVYANPNSL